ncbi:pyrroloquinoline quinone biosynthesis peptide chaperone PqqD [Melaminivora suipulveris]|uniref:Pyrroloquinoline quinone biosynthesis peptide chaperone PqqD n=1 Tax=Melaminivora suipulveris TaxID=2109913 RepID=A0A2R3QDE6_9BURK|nr:pyrroloquinoline quinone biosynthesis peptide chaperone PqqD [Melaminivora suipulveris]AVO49790.1 pyrroloquinoline quinone biosynthesis peptide chaperone PqqD [Melaminivora suipulveris]
MSPPETAFPDLTETPALPRLSRRLRLQYEPAQGRWVLLYPEGMVQLNDSAAEILRRCDGRHTVADIVGELEALFDTRGIATQVQSLIDEGTRRGWLD